MLLKDFCVLATFPNLRICSRVNIDVVAPSRLLSLPVGSVGIKAIGMEIKTMIFL
jgi:hypothetical protein